MKVIRKNPRATGGKIPLTCYRMIEKGVAFAVLGKVPIADIMEKKNAWAYDGKGGMLIHWGDGDVERIHLLSMPIDVRFPFCVATPFGDVKVYFTGTTNEEYKEEYEKKPSPKLRGLIDGSWITYNVASTSDATTVTPDTARAYREMFVVMEEYREALRYLSEARHDASEDSLTDTQELE